MHGMDMAVSAQKHPLYSPARFVMRVMLWLLCAVAIVAMLGGDLWLQVVLFVVISGGLLLALWPFVKKFLNPRHSATNLDSVIGSEGYVITAIDNHSAVGQVKLGGMEWSARSTNGKPVEVGTLVKVDRIEGVKVYVSAVEAEVTV